MFDDDFNFNSEYCRSSEKIKSERNSLKFIIIMENITVPDSNTSYDIDAIIDMEEAEQSILGGTVFADLLSDAGFKTVLTSRDNEDLLVEFINVMLRGERIVKSVKLKPTEFVSDCAGGKKSIVDLYAVDDKGVSFDLEVQRCSEDDLFKRFMGYASRIYYNNLRRGGASADLKPVYVIVLLDDFPKDEDGVSYARRLHSFYTMMEKSAHEVAPATICIIFAVLAYFDKTPEQCVTDLDRWCYMFKNMSRMKEIPEWVQDKVMLKLFKAAKVANFSKEQKQLYVRIMMEDFRTKGMLKAARREGKEEAMLEAARKLLQEGIPAETIAKCTNMDIEAVKQLQS